MKNIVLITRGDSNNPSTWSNVPYKIAESFINKGYNVIRVNMDIKQNIFNYLYTLFFKIIKPNTLYYYIRSKRYRKKVDRLLKEVVDKYDEIADLYISISYDFSPSKYTNKKVLLLSDWTIDYAIRNRFKREPDLFEKKVINVLKDNIEKATYCVSLFKDAADYMCKYYNKDVLYLGLHINAFEPINGFDSIKERKYITFIGGKSYLPSLNQIIDSLQYVKDRRIELHVIGLTNKDVKTKNDRVVFHGYLNKGDEKQRKEYYEVIKNTKMIVNTLPKWGGLSSILECMYYYRPIITNKYDEFVQQFGNNISFGLYTENDSKSIAKSINKINDMSESDYQKMCLHSHDVVKEYTWDNYVEKIISIANIK